MKRVLVAAAIAALTVVAPAQAASTKKRVERAVARAIENQAGYSVVLPDCVQVGPTKWSCDLLITNVRQGQFCHGSATAKTYRSNVSVRWRDDC